MGMKNSNPVISALLHKGVVIPAPESIEIDSAVNPDNISEEGVIIHSGCRIFGESTLICRNTVIGREGPVTIDNCQAGPQVELNSGYFTQAVFLKGVQIGSNAHVREGTLCEEESGIAHTVGLKQTVLFPFTTLGSLINFCDCLLAGGTSRKNHSEVGSSFIHFNYSPNQDKATPSLFGDVPRGVMLREPPIFLGGQGGAVGPLRLTFGTVTAAGAICRKDEFSPGKLIIPKASKGGRISYQAGVYLNVNRILSHNINYIANLMALLQWYHHVRRLFVDPDHFPEKLFHGAQNCLKTGISERIKRLEEFIDNLPRSLEIYTAQNGENAPGPLIQQKSELMEKKEIVTELLLWLAKNEIGELEIRDRFLETLQQSGQASSKDYLTAIIQSMTDEQASMGTAWLQSVVDDIRYRTNDILPSFELW